VLLNSTAPLNPAADVAPAPPVLPPADPGFVYRPLVRARFTIFSDAVLPFDAVGFHGALVAAFPTAESVRVSVLEVIGPGGGVGGGGQQQQTSRQLQSTLDVDVTLRMQQAYHVAIATTVLTSTPISRMESQWFARVNDGAGIRLLHQPVVIAQEMDLVRRASPTPPGEPQAGGGEALAAIEPTLIAVGVSICLLLSGACAALMLERGRGHTARHLEREAEVASFGVSKGGDGDDPTASAAGCTHSRCKGALGSQSGTHGRMVQSAAVTAHGATHQSLTPSVHVSTGTPDPLTPYSMLPVASVTIAPPPEAPHLPALARQPVRVLPPIRNGAAARLANTTTLPCTTVLASPISRESSDGSTIQAPRHI